MTCPHCTTPLPDGSQYCLNCGADLSSPSGERRLPLMESEIQTRLADVCQGRYEVQQLLGSGGMGVVYLARDLRLDRAVAIKVLAPALASDARFVGRFEHEARMAAKLDHPGIIPIYSVEVGGGLHYFVMKFIPGRTLDSVLTTDALPVGRAQGILWEAACALGHAHQQGIVHRDVKPANIMIDDRGHVMLTDFGISKALESGVAFTATGQVVGTPQYVSPEQARGDPLDGRSDQYSLAVVAYRTLSGRIPFDDDSLHALLYKHSYVEPLPLIQLRSDVPEFLAGAIHRSLSKRPADRFPTMEEFATAVLPERPVASPSLRGTEAADRGSRTATMVSGSVPRPRWPALVATAAVVVLLLALGGVVIAKLAGRESGPKPVPTAGTQPTGTTAQSAGPAVHPAPSSHPPALPAATHRAPAVANGYLTVNADPWGTVVIDGVELRDTPVFRYELRPGRYIIGLRREGYRSTVDTVVIAAGATTSLRKTLAPAEP